MLAFDQTKFVKSITTQHAFLTISHQCGNGFRPCVQLLHFISYHSFARVEKTFVMFSRSVKINYVVATSKNVTILNVSSCTVSISDGGLKTVFAGGLYLNPKDLVIVNKYLV